MRRKLLMTTLVLAVSVGIVAPAWAYLDGTSTTLSPTTPAAQTLSSAVSPSAAGASPTSVTISWTNPSPQVPNARYQVVRTGSPNVTVCTQATSPCTDTGLTTGTAYSYTIQTVHTVGGVLDNWQTTAISAGSATPHHTFALAVVSQPTTATAGTATTPNVVLSATEDGSADPTPGALTWTAGVDSSPSGATPTLPTSVTWTSGQASFAITLVKAESDTLTVKDANGASVSLGAITVSPGSGSLSLSSCSISAPASTTCPANGAVLNVNNGATFTASVSRSTTDADGNVLTLSAGTATINIMANKGTITSPSNSQLTFSASSTSGGSFTYKQIAAGNGTITIPLAGWGSYVVTPHA